MKKDLRARIMCINMLSLGRVWHSSETSDCRLLGAWKWKQAIELDVTMYPRAVA